MNRRTRISAHGGVVTVVVANLACTIATADPGGWHRPSWAKYVAAPASRDVHPVRVLAATAGVTNPEGALGRGVTTLTRNQPPAPPVWPAASTATASSFHAPNTDNGVPRSYGPGNALDGDPTTFWNDDTIAGYPDVLTIAAPVSVNLPGITILSHRDGVTQDYTVETWSGAGWQLQATVTGNLDLLHAVPFAAPVSTTSVRITVTRDQSTGKGEFTRIAEVYPGIVAADAPPSLTVDFGKVVVGYPRIDFAGGSANHPGVRLAFSETVQYLTDVSDFTRSNNGATITPGTDQIAVPVTPIVWTDARGCADGTKVCADGLHGFRYLKISLDALPQDAPDTQAYGTVSLSGVALEFTAYLGTPASYRGWFESSDEQLNQFWYHASYTDELMVDTFRPDDVDPRGADSPSLDGKLVLHDGAKRDRDPYVGDVAVSGRTAYLTHGDGLAARNVLADLADHQRADGWIPPASINHYTLPLFDYPFWWVTSSWDYVLYTGDTGYATTYYPQLVRVLDTWAPSVTDDHGALAKGLNNTGGYGDYAFLGRTGEVTYYNALYVQALRDAAQLAAALGHADDAARWGQRAVAVAGAINTYLWDDASGAYLDSAVGPVRHGQDGNGLAVVAGVADPARAISALDYLAQHTALPYGNAFMDNDTLVADGSQRVYAFTSYPEIRARFLAGQADSAIAEIKRLYGWMATHDPGITAWEGIGPGGSMYEQGFTSAAHGWSTGVVPALTNDLLGALPMSPGFATWSVQPHPGSIAWARGELPTPHGGLVVEWHRHGGAAFALTVMVPRGTSGTVSVPVAAPDARVELDGRPVWRAGHAWGSAATLEAGYVVVPGVGPGRHTVVVNP